MTNEEAKKMLKAKLECLIRETSGTDIDCNHRNCDECNLCYEQGNMGEQKEALELAIKALNQEPSEDAEVIKISKGAVKARQGRYVIYDVEWLKKNFYTTEEKIYGQPKEPCEDCISREAVDEYITNLLSGYLYDEERTRLEDLTAYIWELPSVTPKYTDEEIDRAQAVEQAYIDKMVELAVEKLKRPKGEWISKPLVYGVTYCSECDFELKINNTNYCPNCGARMIESEEEE